MSIALVGSPPPTPSYRQLITGNDSEFTTTIGAWTNTGGTQTRDTSYRWSAQVASLKLATTAAGQYTSLPVSGSFVSGAEYVVFLGVSLEETGITAASIRVQFGLIGTDAASESGTFTPSTRKYGFNGTNNWGVVSLRWKPTAARTGVTVRVERLNADGSNTQTWHVGWAKAFRVPTLDGPATVIDPYVAGSRVTFVSPHFLNNNTGLGIGPGTGVVLGGRGEITIYHGNGLSGLAADEENVYIYGEHAAGDLAERGVQFNVGADYVGLQIGEKDSDTLQMYSDFSTGYMMQLRNRGSNKGWAISDDGTVNQKLTDTFQWPFYVAGAQTTGTNKAAYFQVPEKCLIDEVRIHLGTAPTGSSFIVDVNDDGTTIFTTQGNRPEIAISGTDDTSGAADGGTAVAKDSVLTIDVDQIGSTIAGSDLVVFVRGRFIW